MTEVHTFSVTVTELQKIVPALPNFEFTNSYQFYISNHTSFFKSEKFSTKKISVEKNSLSWNETIKVALKLEKNQTLKPKVLPCFIECFEISGKKTIIAKGELSFIAEYDKTISISLPLKFSAKKEDRSLPLVITCAKEEETVIVQSVVNDSTFTKGSSLLQEQEILELKNQVESYKNTIKEQDSQIIKLKNQAIQRFIVDHGIQFSFEYEDDVPISFKIIYESMQYWDDDPKYYLLIVTTIYDVLQQLEKEKNIKKGIYWIIVLYSLFNVLKKNYPEDGKNGIDELLKNSSFTTPSLKKNDIVVDTLTSFIIEIYKLLHQFYCHTLSYFMKKIERLNQSVFVIPILESYYEYFTSVKLDSIIINHFFDCVMVLYDQLVANSFLNEKTDSKKWITVKLNIVQYQDWFKSKNLTISSDFFTLSKQIADYCSLGKKNEVFTDENARKDVCPLLNRNQLSFITHNLLEDVKEDFDGSLISQIIKDERKEMFERELHWPESLLFDLVFNENLNIKLPDKFMEFDFLKPKIDPLVIKGKKYLKIFVGEGSNIPKMDIIGSCDPFIVFTIGNSKIVTTFLY